MPEAAIDEHGNSRAGEDDVRPAWQRSVLDAESQAEVVQRAPECEFGARALGGHRAHLLANHFVEWCRCAPPGLAACGLAHDSNLPVSL